MRACDYSAMTQYPIASVDALYPNHVATSFPGGESVRMVTERVGALLCEICHDHDGKSVLLIGHRATRYALEYWCGTRFLEDIVRERWECRAVPIWRYSLRAEDLARRAPEEPIA